MKFYLVGGSIEKPRKRFLQSSVDKFTEQDALKALVGKDQENGVRGLLLFRTHENAMHYVKANAEVMRANEVLPVFTVKVDKSFQDGLANNYDMNSVTIDDVNKHIEIEKVQFKGTGGIELDFKPKGTFDICTTKEFQSLEKYMKEVGKKVANSKSIETVPFLDMEKYGIARWLHNCLRNDHVKNNPQECAEYIRLAHTMDAIVEKNKKDYSADFGPFGHLTNQNKENIKSMLVTGREGITIDHLKKGSKSKWHLAWREMQDFNEHKVTKVRSSDLNKHIRNLHDHVEKKQTEAPRYVQHRG